MAEKLTYIQLTSFVNPTFWSKLTELKLDVDRLSEAERHVWAYFPMLTNCTVPHPYLEVDSTAFNKDFNSQNMYVPFEGTISNKNTSEQFKECDKMSIISAAGANLYRSIVSGEALERPSILNSFLILSFADLKKYDYYYWFAFVVPKNLFIEVMDKSNMSAIFTKEIIATLYSEFQQLSPIQKTYFLVDSKINKILTLKEVKGLTIDDSNDFYFAFFNISICPELVGSQLRNYAALLTHVCPFLQNTTQKFLSITCSRDGSEINIDKSMVFHLRLPTVSENTLNTWVGWEKNERDRLGPKVAHMKSTLDPAVLAENSVDLNLKLMKWRVVPDINLEKIKLTKCLLLGSGTLGCCVARSLLAWGVRNITIVDNSTVSFSNPVRQSLFTYEDSVKLRPKAEAAADRLKEIFPGVKSKGVQLTIPMPGHTVSESTLEQTTKSVAVLTDLIKESDVVFLLMDSRESRWLPAMLGSFYNKIVINAALGFDSYLVMRHGAKRANTSSDDSLKELKGFQSIEGRNLGCYFCNDVTAPGDSVKNRTLDQQCTVTRPGIAQIAGALAVELAVSILQHNDGLNASAFYKLKCSPDDLPPEIERQCLLGLLPHSIRGFLPSFSNILPATIKYDKCVACSHSVLEEYESKGFEFLLKVFNSSKHLEDVAKLTALLESFDFNQVMELSDEVSD